MRFHLPIHSRFTDTNATIAKQNRVENVTWSTTLVDHHFIILHRLRCLTCTMPFKIPLITLSVHQHYSPQNRRQITDNKFDYVASAEPLLSQNCPRSLQGEPECRAGPAACSSPADQQVFAGGEGIPVRSPLPRHRSLSSACISNRVQGLLMSISGPEVLTVRDPITSYEGHDG